MDKRLKTLPLAVSDEDLEKLDRCRSLYKIFTPKRSRLGLCLLRFAMHRLLQGEVTIKQISREDSIEPIAGNIGERDYIQIQDDDIIERSCVNCGGIVRWAIRGASAETIEREWREHSCLETELERLTYFNPKGRAA